MNKNNFSLNLGLANQTLFSKEDAALFLIVLGKTCQALNCTPLEIVGSITKENWRAWHLHLMAEGYAGDADQLLHAGRPKKRQSGILIRRERVPLSGSCLGLVTEGIG